MARIGAAIVFITALALFLPACSGKMKMLRDEVDLKYIIREYGDATLDFAEMNPSFLDYFKRNHCTAVSENASIPAARKKALVKRIESCTYEENRYFSYYIRTAAPFRKEKLNFQFRLTDASGASQLEEVFMLEDKSIVLGATGSGDVTYQYIWLIKARKPLDAKNVSRKEVPVKLSVIFPDGRSRVYLVDTSR